MTNDHKTEEELIKEAKRAYHREYYRKNRKKLNAQSKRWRDENPEKAAESNRKYWAKKVQGKRA